MVAGWSHQVLERPPFRNLPVSIVTSTSEYELKEVAKDKGNNVQCTHRYRRQEIKIVIGNEANRHINLVPVTILTIVPKTLIHLLCSPSEHLNECKMWGTESVCLGPCPKVQCDHSPVCVTAYAALFYMLPYFIFNRTHLWGKPELESASHFLRLRVPCKLAQGVHISPRAHAQSFSSKPWAPSPASCCQVREDACTTG